MLTYMITAHDLATPIFRAFTGEVNAMTRQVQTSLAELNRALKAQQLEMDKMAASSRTMAAETSKSTVAMDSAAASAGGLGSKERDLQAAQVAATASSAKHKEALVQDTAAMAGAGSGSQKLGRDVKGATTEIEKHKKGIQEAGYALSGYSGQLGPFGRSLDTAAKHAQLFRSQGIDYVAAGMVGLGATFAVESVKAASMFDKLGASIQQQAGVSAKEAGRLVDVVKQVATQSPAAYKEIAAAVSTQYKLLHENSAQIQQNSDLFLAFADKAGRQVTPSIVALNQAMRLFHPTGMSIVDMMDQLTNLAQHTQQPLGDYLGILQKYGPSLQAMGLSFQQTIGLFDAFGKAGISMTAVGRGLTTAMSKAATEIKTANAAAAGGPAKLQAYGLAVDSAQIRVNTLSGQLASGKGNQQKLNDEMQVAQGRLDAAKQKYDALNTVLHHNANAHLTVTQVVGKEMAAIESAKTKQDALNLSIAAFGGNMGAKMADALWHNKAALDGMNKSLGDAKGKTDDLAKAQRDTLSGQLAIVGHDFTNIAGTVGKDLLPVLKDAAHVLGSIATGISQFSSGSTKGLSEVLMALGVGGGALTLAARHTPLGALTSRLPGPLGDILSRQKDQKSGSPLGGGPLAEATGGIWGFTGTQLRVGSEANPIAVMMAGGLAPGAAGAGETLATRESPAALGAATAEAGAAGAAVTGDAALTARGGSILAAANAERAAVAAAAAATAAASTSTTTASLLAKVGGASAGRLAGALGAEGLFLGNAVFGSGGGGGPRGMAAQGLSGLTTGLVSPGAIRGVTDSINSLGGDILKQIPLIGGPLNNLLNVFGGSSGPDPVAKMKQLDAQIQAAASSGNVSKLQELGRKATEMGAAFTSSGSSAGASFTALGQRVQVVAANASNALSGPLQTALTRVAQYGFPAVTKAMNDTSLTVDQRSASIVASLTNIADHGTGPMAKNAKTALDQLRASVGSDLQAMASQTTTSMGQMKVQIQDGSATARSAGTQNFNAFAKAVQSAMAAGTYSTAAGAQMISNTLVSTLKAFGASGSTISTAKVLASINPSQAQNLLAEASAGVTAGGLASPHATGGRVPGPVGGDSWKLIDPSGRHAAMVGGGELLIGNRHTEAKVNTLLSPYGTTLGAMVAGETTPHSAPGRYATGGRVAGQSLRSLDHVFAANGGQTLPPTVIAAIAEAAGLPGITFSQIAQGESSDQPGAVQKGQPYGTTGWGLWQITPGNSVASVGVDNALLDPITNARAAKVKYDSQGMGAWFGTKYWDHTIRHWTGQSLGGIAGVGAGAGGGMSVPSVPTPRVVGGGMVGAIAQAALSKIAGAANARLSSLASVAGGAGGLGGGVNFLPGGGRSETIPHGASPGLSAMISEANAIASHHYNYEWGGGHSSIGVPTHGVPGGPSGPGIGFDCSGAVSAVLHSAGLLNSPMVASNFMTWGLPGPGKSVNIFADPSHTFMELAGHYFGTSGQNPGGGANWIPSFPGNIGGPRHPPGYATGGYVVDQTQFAPGKHPIRGLLPGLSSGGRVGYAGAFGTGGTFTATRPTLALFGDNGAETVHAIPHATAGAAFASDLVAPSSYAPPASTRKPKTTHESTRISPLTGKVETHTAAEWLQIELEARRQHKNLATAKARHTAYEEHVVQDPLRVGSLTAGSLDLTRRAAGKEHLPSGGPISLLEDFSKLLGSTFKKIESALKSGLASDSTMQSLKLANSLAQGIARHHLKATSRNAQLENIIIGAAEKSVTGDFTAQQSAQTHSQSILSLIAAAPPGSTAKSLGLSSAQLRASGLSAAQIRALSNPATGPAAMAAATVKLSQNAIKDYQGDAQHLESLYKDALKTHNKKLQASLLSQLDAVTQAQLKAQGDLQTAMVAMVDATVKQFTDAAATQAGAASILATIQGLAPGTSLAGLGLSPTVLAQLGVSSTQASGLEGSDLGYLQTLMTAQGGTLTAAQLASAQAGVGAQNTALGAQRATDIAGVNALEAQIPTLTGAALTDAQTQLGTLVNAILALTGQINTNNTSLATLTTSVNANTTATTSSTGAMTGSVGFSYQSQNYVAGGSMTSDTPSSIAVGM
jgi:hypothetical protein